MKQYKMLVLTDHRNHSAENSLYPLVHALRGHPSCAQIDVATRGESLNDSFFDKYLTNKLNVIRVEEDFGFHPNGRAFNKNKKEELVGSYDVIWLRMPPPLSKAFLVFLKEKFSNVLILNDPIGIFETGSKEFLMNFQEWCPPMQLCFSLEDIIRFKSKFPIVLKPFREYGGKGIVRIDGEKVWEGKEEMTFDQFVEKLQGQTIAYLGVKFLKNVGQGDKRIVVVNGEIMGASLRLPPKDSWICNVSMGGQSNPSEADEEEQEIVAHINPLLKEKGIIMYGVDTLVNDNGRRVLSEINTTSIGGLPQIAQLTGKPLLQRASELIWNYIKNVKNNV